MTSRGDSRRLGARLFSFAVIADTHVNQEEGKASSDFAVNRLANARNRHVVHEINRHAPAFVLHLGDIVHPTPIHPGYAAAAASFHALASELECPLYLTPGNHDVGDKPGDWLPVPSVNDDFLALYRRHFGRNFRSFDANGCHFVIIDAQIVNSGLAVEAEQRAWLEADLVASAGRRTFLCTHYPPYLFDPDEAGHYDNLDEPGRSWLLGLCTGHGVEAVFAGHVHNFWYHLYRQTEIYLLPSTAFVRLDYSELFRIGPAEERGRNDTPKLGFFLVDVHERGHVAYAIRTWGAELAPGATLDRSVHRLPPVHTKTIGVAPLGIDLRYPWAEKVDIPASGALDEFTRKTARNDYPLMSLWEMGIRRLRVPVADLANPETRERMTLLKRAGHAFTVYTHGVPGGAMWNALTASLAIVDTWEIIAPVGTLDRMLPAIRDIRAREAIEIHLSPLRRHDDPDHHGQAARHVIQHGFGVDARDEVHALARHAGVRETIDGFVFRVDRGHAPWDALSSIAETMRATGKRGHAYVRLAADSPSVAIESELAIANRVGESAIAALVLPQVGVVLDTLADVDRGYFPRTGLIDRRHNPRMAGRVCRHLHAMFDTTSFVAKAGRAFDEREGRVLALEGADEDWYAMLPAAERMVVTLPRLRSGGASSGNGRRVDLVRGTIAGFDWHGEPDRPLQLSEGIHCAGPTLWRVPR
jgi:3',5'-cyclic AMP phosphodiesterase CpdA